jgi:hypothetical protein
VKKYERNNIPIVYIDESGFAYDIPRTHGYSVRGERCFGTHDWNAKGRENVIGAVYENNLIACGICNFNIDTDVFNTWIEKDLIPKLPKHSVVVMDNATFHKSQKTKILIESNGHKIAFLPPYSPDLNPIEHKWAQAKAKRRKYHSDTSKNLDTILL